MFSNNKSEKLRNGTDSGVDLGQFIEGAVIVTSRSVRFWVSCSYWYGLGLSRVLKLELLVLLYFEST